MELLIVTAAAVIVFLLVEGSKTNPPPPSASAPTGSAGAAGSPSANPWADPNFNPDPFLGLPNATYDGFPVTDANGDFVVLGPVRPN